MKLRRLFGRDGDDGSSDPDVDADEAVDEVESDEVVDVDVDVDTDGDTSSPGGDAGADHRADEDEAEGDGGEAGSGIAVAKAADRDDDPEADEDEVEDDSAPDADTSDSDSDSDDDTDADADADADADTDEVEDAGGAADDDGGFQEVDFELSDWGAPERKLLDEMLQSVRVRRVWQAGTLVVGTGDAEIVDDLIDEIEDRRVLNLAPGVEPVIYDVRDWPEGLEDRFVEALIEGRVAHMRGYQEITVGVDDEEKVDTLVEEVTAAWEDEQPEESELDGPDAQEVLSELFVSADRLLHDASDKTATVRFDDAATTAGTMALPFGFEQATWDAITAAVDALRDLLGDAKAQDTDIEESATELRSLLRPLV